MAAAKCRWLETKNTQWWIWKCLISSRGTWTGCPYIVRKRLPGINWKISPITWNKTGCWPIELAFWKSTQTHINSLPRACAKGTECCWVGCCGNKATRLRAQTQAMGAKKNPKLGFLINIWHKLWGPVSHHMWSWPDTAVQEADWEVCEKMCVLLSPLSIISSNRVLNKTPFFCYSVSLTTHERLAEKVRLQ